MSNISKREERVLQAFVSAQRNTTKKKNLTEENKQKLLDLKDKHKGERCFIIGTSPSLKMLDLTMLNNEYTFTANRGYKLKEQGLMRSNYHIMPDPSTLNDDGVRNEIPSDFTELFLIQAEIDFPSHKNIVYFDRIDEISLKGLIPEDIISPFISYRTVIAYAMQFAYFMGFKEINIIGVDLDFSVQAGHAYSETEGEIKRQKEDSIKERDRMLIGLENIAKQLQAKNILLQNASPVGVLNCIDRIDYAELFNV